jgi:hypothetical protein
MVFVRGEQNRARCSKVRNRIQRCSKQGSADPLAPMVRIHHEIIDDACWPAERHIIVPLHSSEGIAHNLAFPFGNQDRHFRTLRLRDEKRAVPPCEVWDRRDEASGIELVVFRYEQRAEAAKGRAVGCHRGSD